MKTYFLLYQPSQLDLRLVLQDGKVLGHLPNYLRVFVERPTNNDGAAQILEFKAHDKDIHIVRDDGVDKVYIWAGDRGTRSNPQDLIRVEIAHVGAQASVTSAAMLAKEAFAGLPDDVKLAVVVAHTPQEVLDGIDLADVERLTTWADKTLVQYTSQKG